MRGRLIMDKSRTEDNLRQDIYIEGEIKKYGDKKRCFIKQSDYTQYFYELIEINHTQSFYELKKNEHPHSLYELKAGDDIEVKDHLNGENDWIPGKVTTEDVLTEGYTIDEDGLRIEKYMARNWFFEGGEKTIRLLTETPARIRIIS